MDLKNAPKSKDSVLGLKGLEKRLHTLVGTPLTLAHKPRTDGSTLRKIVSQILEDRVSNALEESEYEILPPKGKGVPRILVELLDTYVVTSGDTYNLQVWNRIPNSDAPLVRYNNGEYISAKDIRFVLIKVDMDKEIIESVVIMTPQYIEDTFGSFGKPTIKQQLLVSNKIRQQIIDSNSHIYLTPDTAAIRPHLAEKFIAPKSLSSDMPITGEILSIGTICERVAKKLIGKQLESADTKTRGQLLEKEVIELLKYHDNIKLVGGYPDVPNQLLEVKVQDTQTIDLGKYSPQFTEIINEALSLSTKDVRYLIALTNPDTKIIEGVILSSGERLGDVFTYVSDKSFKCQRSIPMTFFNDFIGQCVSNPLT